MQRFFFDNESISESVFSVTDEKFKHIVKVLRMNIGEKAVFCDGDYFDYLCELIEIRSDSAIFKVLDKYKNTTESDVRITVFQCLPKGDKLDDMIKRCVQFGAYEVVPVLSKRCVSRPDSKSTGKKVERLNKIALSSAMQSMRGYIPKVKPLIDFKSAVNDMKNYSTSFICYEDERNNVISASKVVGNEIAFLVGPEGGFDKEEVDYAIANGITSISLGRRILRTEDAAAFFIPILLSITDNL